jgi:hypothetical protein
MVLPPTRFGQDVMSVHGTSFRCDAEFSPSAKIESETIFILDAGRQRAMTHRHCSHGVHREMLKMHWMLLIPQTLGPE